MLPCVRLSRVATAPSLSRVRTAGTHPSSGSVEPPWDSVRELYRILRGVTQEALNPRGLLVSEYHALVLCARNPVPLKSITQSLGVTPAATTDLARRLVHRRLIRLVPHPTDRRSRLAILTVSGHRLLGHARDDLRKALRELGVTISPEAREGLLRGVAELRRALAVPGNT
jgi:DNA-binding MarR family transcriptional regulator